MTIKYFTTLAAITMAVFFVTSPLATLVFAQDFWAASTSTPTQPEEIATVVINQDVSFPYGQWVEDVGDIAKAWLVPALLGVMTWVTGKYVPLPLRGMANRILTAQAEQILQKAIDFGVRATQGAEGDGAELTVPVANEVLRKAANYVLANGWPKLIDFMDGPDGILQKLFARMNFPITASAKDFPNLPSVGVTKDKFKQITWAGKDPPSWVMMK